MKVIRQLTVRSKSALTTDWVSGMASPVSDTGNTEDTNQDLTSSGGEADVEWVARKFTATTSGKILSAAMVFGKTGSPEGTLAAYIFTDLGGLPAYILGGPSDSVTCTDLSAEAGGASQSFTWSREAPELTANLAYWVAVKSAGYTYVNNTTEVRWRTDADGAVAANECAKCLLSTSPFWSTMGANVGADLTVTYVPVYISLAGSSLMILLVDFTKGSSGGLRLKLEYSHDQANWFQEQVSEIAGGIASYVPKEHFMEATGNYVMEFDNLSHNYARISVKALTSETNAQVGLVALVRNG